MRKGQEINCYTYGEGFTAGGHLVEFTCRNHEDVEKVKELLSLVRTIEQPTTKLVGGDIERLSRFKIMPLYDKHGNTLYDGFKGALEVVDSPDGRQGIIVYACDQNWFGCYTINTYSFYEFETKQQAIKAWLKFDKSFKAKPDQQPGCIRRVRCGSFEPWFHAVADQEIVGDLLVPSEIEEDGVFRFGRKFIVHGETYYSQEIPKIKVCWGTKAIKREETFYGTKKWTDKYIFWHDGTISKFSSEEIPSWIEPLEGIGLLGQMVIAEACQVAAGMKDKAEVVCADTSRVEIKWIPAASSKRKRFKGGNYTALVRADNGKEIKLSPQEFIPKPGVYTVEDYFKRIIGNNIITYWPKNLPDDWDAEDVNPNDGGDIKRFKISPIAEIIEIKLEPASTRNKKKWVGFFPDPRDREQ